MTRVTLDPETLWPIIATGSPANVARALKPHGVTVHETPVPERAARIDADAYRCGKYARETAKQMVQAVVQARYDRTRGRGDQAWLCTIEAELARRLFHKLLRNWRDVPGFMRGYRAAGRECVS